MVTPRTPSLRGAAPLTVVLSLLFACGGSNAGSSSASSAQAPGGSEGATPGAGGDGGASQAGGDAAGGPGGAESGPPAVQLVGRFDLRDPVGPRCAWPGCRIVARFAGTQVSVRLREEVQVWMTGAPSEWDVAVDGVWQPKLVMPATGGDEVYSLAGGLPDGVHVVELYKRSEAQNGTTQFLGYDFGAGRLLAPPARKTRRLEIVGDSAASGYGVEGVGLGPDCPGPDHASRYQSFRKSMGARLGEIFDAEVAGTVHSGKGIAKNIWTQDKETMPLLFPRVIPSDPTSTWDFSAFVPDVVVTMLGGNDFEIGQPADEGPATMTEFTAAYAAFVASLRERYPDAHLLLTVSPTISDAQPEGRRTRSSVIQGVTEVSKRRNAEGDAKVVAFEPGVATAAERAGCEGHGDAQFHDRVAQEIAAQIRTKTGW